MICSPRLKRLIRSHPSKPSAMTNNLMHKNVGRWLPRTQTSSLYIFFTKVKIGNNINFVIHTEPRDFPLYISLNEHHDSIDLCAQKISDFTFYHFYLMLIKKAHPDSCGYYFSIFFFLIVLNKSLRSVWNLSLSCNKQLFCFIVISHFHHSFSRAIFWGANLIEIMCIFIDCAYVDQWVCLTKA